MCINYYSKYIESKYLQNKCIEERVDELMSIIKEYVGVDFSWFRNNLLQTNKDKLSFTYLGPGNYQNTKSCVWKVEKLLLPTIDGEKPNEYNCVLEYAYHESGKQNIYFLSETKK